MEILGGRLCNTPSITSINAPRAKLEHINKGDAFIARSSCDVALAISHGAYAIVSEEYYEITDSEIAWILVESLDTALLKFIKYHKIINNIEIFRCDTITFQIAAHVVKSRQIAFAGNVDTLLESLAYACIVVDFEILLFDTTPLIVRDSANRALDSTKDSAKDSIDSTRDSAPFHIIKQTLFDLKIEYEGEIYQLIMPCIWTNHLSAVVEFCRTRHFELNLNADFTEFLPIFINSQSRVSSYGMAMRFIYASKSADLVEKYVDFVKLAKWGKSLLLTPKARKKRDDIEVREYRKLGDLRAFFALSQYHFFIVFGAEQSEILGLIDEPQDSAGLFD